MQWVIILIIASEESLTSTRPFIDAVVRSLQIDDDATSDDAVALRLTLALHGCGAPTDLFPLLTDPQHLARWYGPVTVDGGEGGAFTAPGGVHGTIRSVQSPHRVDLTWEYEGRADELTLRIDPTDDGSSSLLIEHSLAMPAEVFAQYGPGAAALGWEIALMGFARYAEIGGDASIAACAADLPAPDPVWLASEDGAQTVRAWAIRWAAAAIAAGVPEATARVGEENTVRAYIPQAAQS